MYYDVALRDHVAPRNLRVSVAKFGRQGLGGLPQDRQVVRNSLLGVSIGFKALFIAFCQIADVRERRAHISDAFHVYARTQSGTASRSMR